MKLTKRGQTLVEYITLIVIILAAFFGIQNYFKRGIQGRWKASVDDLGDQYDPRTANTYLQHTLMSNTTTIISITEKGTEGYFTDRTDNSVSTEIKKGTLSVGAY